MGTFDNLWGDNVWCRALHVRLTPIRPDVSPFNILPDHKQNKEWRTLLDTSMVLIGLTRFIVHMSVPMEEASASTCLITRPTLTTRRCSVNRQGRRLSALENGLETRCTDRG